MARGEDGDGVGHNQRNEDPSRVENLDSALLKRMAEDFLAGLGDGKYDGSLVKGLKRAHKPGPEQRKLLAKRLVNERFRKWGLQDDDPTAKDVGARFVKLSLRVPEEALRSILETAESIVTAEKAKAAWNPKAYRKQYRRLSRTGVSAAKLAIEIAEIFPPPWEGEQAPLGLLIESLFLFVNGAVMATTHLSRETLSVLRNAHRTLQSTRPLLTGKTGRTHWELIRDLVWLASGKRSVRLSERTIRRYLEEPNGPRIPEKDYWNSHWNDLVRLQRLVPARNTDRLENSDPFAIAALRFLTPLD